jgi:hypothetical protein
LLDADAGSLALAKPPTETTAERADSRARGAAAGGDLQRADAGGNRRVDGHDRADSTLARYRSIHAEGQDPCALLGAQPRNTGEPPPATDFTLQYSGANRVVELRFAKPLERFRTVAVDLLEGILGTDGQPLKPWTLTFSIGGS